MTEDTRYTSLGELCKPDRGGLIQTGPFGSQLHASDYTVAGTPVVMPANIADNRIDTSGIARVGDDHTNRLSRHRLRPGDVVYSRRGDITRRALVREEEAGWLCGTGCLLVRPGADVDPRWLSFWLGAPWTHEYLLQRAVGATMANLNTGILSGLPVGLPPLDEQRRIAGVLGALDDLAGTCEKLSQALMTLTRLLFRQRVTTNPAVVRLGDVLEFRYGKSLPAHARTEGAVPVVSSAGVVGTHSEALVAGPGVVVGRKGSVGTVHWVPTDFFPIDTAFFVETELPTLVAFLALESAGLEKLNTDSAVPGLNRANALAQQVSLMTTDEIPVFAAQVVELWQAAEQLNAEAAQARTTRDELLPLLLSGRVRVGEVAA